nr:exodeoxyribonuclease VII large subunit [Lachnospiraceae bacterium]
MVYRLNVPYSEKDEAKSLGAKWYASEKYWYYKGESLPQGLKRWYREENGKESRGIGSDVLSFGGSDDTGKNDRNLYANYRTVSEVNTMISEIVYATNEFRSILVKGEVTNFDGKNGRHYYFAIKDEWALLPCVMWDHTAAYALNFKLEKGQQVALSGSLEFY